MKLVQRIVLEYYKKKFLALSVISSKKAANSAFRLFCTPYTRKKDKPTPVFEKGEKLSLVVGGAKVLGFKWKPVVEANGNTLLICHGFDSCSFRFTDYIIALLDAGFDVLAFDAPANGISHGKTITILQYSEMIQKINSTFGPVNGIMAHSLGGLAAVLALESMPDNQCKQLIIVAPSTESTHAIEKFLQFLQINDKVKKEFYDLVESMGGNPISWFSVARAIENINVKTLWIHDKKDSVTPYKHMEHLTLKNLPHIEFEITEGLGHSPYRDPAIRQKILTCFTSMIPANSVAHP